MITYKFFARKIINLMGNGTHSSTLYTIQINGLLLINLWFTRPKPMVYKVQTYALALVNISSSQSLLLTPYYLLPITYYLLPITCYLLPNKNCFILENLKNFSKNTKTSLYPLKALCINGFTLVRYLFNTSLIPPSYLPKSTPK